MDLELTAIVFAGVGAVAFAALSMAYAGAMRAAAGMDAVRQQESPVYKFTTPAKLVAARFACGAAVGIVAMWVLLSKGVDGFFPLALAGTVGAILGGKAPLKYYAAKAKKRKEKFDEQILNLTMSLANGLRSGYALEAALRASAENALDPMKEELFQTLQEHTAGGVDLSEALERLHARMPGEDLRLLITSIRLTSETGGELSGVLKKMVEMIRARTEFQEKLKTMTAQGRFQAVAMACAPAAVYVILRLIDPDLMRPLTSTVAGWTTIVIVAAFVSLGFFIINRIVTIEV